MIAEKETRILVVDDDKQLADMLVNYLIHLGYQAVAAYGGYDALSTLKQGDFQLIITDLNMPDMDGIKLLEAAKSLDKRVVVVVITGYGTIESAVEAIKKGAYDFIPKPFNMEELEIIVNRAMERHSLSRKLEVFRGLTLAMIISVPVWLILGIVLAMAWK